MTPKSRATDSGGDAPRTDQRAAGLFIRYLMELPLLDWIEAARRRGVDARRHDAETTLRVRLRQLDHHGDVFATKDGVLAALQRFECHEGRQLTRLRSATEHLRPATEDAALAVLVRASLSDRDFETLYAPFADVIPRELIIGLPR